MSTFDLARLLKKFSTTLPKFEDGRIDYSKSNIAPVLICFVKFQDRILLLKRSMEVNTYQGQWNSVAGYLDEFKPLKEKVLIELDEELGLKKDTIQILKFGEPFEFFDSNIRKNWIIFPAIARLKNKPKIRLDREHSEFQWIRPSDLDQFDIVPNLKKSLNRVINL